MKRYALVVLAAVVLGATVAAAAPSGSRRDVRVTAWFSRAVELFPGSDVRVLGLPAGKVDAVTPIGSQVRVRLTVRGDVPLPADVQATIVPSSLIGDRYVQLFPAWTGGAKLADGATIPASRTTIPVELDEALASLNNLVQSLDPTQVHKLVHGLAQDLQGTGEELNGTLRSLGRIVGTLGDKSDDIGALVDNFDAFTRALASRESKIGAVLDDFATLTNVLAEQRSHIEGIVKNLSSFASDARDIVAENAATIGGDLASLARVARAIQANTSSLSQFLTAQPIFAKGLLGAYNPTYRRLDLRVTVEPDLASAMDALGQLLGVPVPQACVPVTVSCEALLGIMGSQP